MPKRRVTPEQEQGDIGQLQFAERAKQFGWQARGLSPDLGEDFIVDIYEDGASAGMAFYAQLKSSLNLSKYKLKDGDYSYTIDVADLQHWCDYFPPVVLVLWDIKQRSGYWTTIADVLTRLEREIPAWEEQKSVRVRVPSTNLTDEDGLKRLRHAVASVLLPAFLEGRQLEVTLQFCFSDDAAGRVQRNAIARHYSSGDGVAINGRFLTDIAVSDWYERKFGKPAINTEGQLVLGPRHCENIERLRLTLLSPQGRALKVQVVEVKAVRVGNDQLTFANEHRPTPFSFHLTAHTSGHFSPPKKRECCAWKR